MNFARTGQFNPAAPSHNRVIYVMELSNHPRWRAGVCQENLCARESRIPAAKSCLRVPVPPRARQSFIRSKVKPSGDAPGSWCRKPAVSGRFARVPPGAEDRSVMTTSGDVLYVVVYKYLFPARGRDPVGREPSGLSPLPEDRPLPAPVTSVRQSGRPRREDLSSGIFNFGWDLLFALVQNSPDPLNILHKWR